MVDVGSIETYFDNNSISGFLRDGKLLIVRWKHFICFCCIYYYVNIKSSKNITVDIKTKPLSSTEQAVVPSGLLDLGNSQFSVSGSGSVQLRRVYFFDYEDSYGNGFQTNLTKVCFGSFLTVETIFFPCILEQEEDLDKIHIKHLGCSVRITSPAPSALCGRKQFCEREMLLFCLEYLLGMHRKDETCPRIL